VNCIGKGKAHKKYELGTKASRRWWENPSLNIHDSQILIDVISQSTEQRGVYQECATCDRGYRGKFKVDETQSLISEPSGKRAVHYQCSKMRKRFQRRAGSEPIIGHLKSDFRVARNFFKGRVYDSINLMLSATGYNLKT